MVAVLPARPRASHDSHFLRSGRLWLARGSAVLNPAQESIGGSRGVALRGYDRYIKRNHRKGKEALPFNLVSLGSWLPGISDGL